MSLFKKCTCCDHPWFSRDEFLEDSKLELVGYQVNFGELELGYFLFNHLTCQSTIAIPAGMFRDLYDGPVFSQRLTETEQCPGHCLHDDILQPCSAPCECAYVREVLQIVQNWPKNEDQPARIARRFDESKFVISSSSNR